jgi:acyl-CoA thioesterase
MTQILCLANDFCITFSTMTRKNAIRALEPDRRKAYRFARIDQDEGTTRMDDMTSDKQRIAERCAERLWPQDTASRELGMTIVDIGPGRATLTMTVEPSMLNGHATCHGGFIFTLADSAFAFACNSHDERTVASSADISFVQPARAGDELRAEAVEVFREGRNGITDVRVVNQAGETVAMFRGKSRTIGGGILDDQEGA